MSLRKKPMFVGVEIGGTKLQLVAGSEEAVIQDRLRFQVERQAGARGIQHHIAESLANWRQVFDIRAIGVGFGGPVDWRAGTVCCSHHVEGWSGFGMRSWIQSMVPAPVAMDNDANVACLGEARRGAGAGARPVLYVTLGSGVGGGFVVEEGIYHGALPGEVEIGHVRLDRNGATVESRCSGWAMDRHIRAAVREDPGSILARLVAGQAGGEARFLGAALGERCPVAGKLLDQCAEDLAFGLSHATHLLHPSLVVLGGGLSLLGEPLRSRVASRLPGFVMEAFQPGPEVRLAGLGEDAVPIGALLLAQDAVGC